MSYKIKDDSTNFNSKASKKDSELMNSENYFSKFKNYPSRTQTMKSLQPQKSGATTVLLSQKPSIKESHLESNCGSSYKNRASNSPYGKIVYPKNFNKKQIYQISSCSQLSEESLKNFFEHQAKVLQEEDNTPKNLYEAAKQIFDIFDEEKQSKIPLERIDGLEQIMSDFFQMSKRSTSTENLANFDSFNPKKNAKKKINILGDLDVEGDMLSKKDFELWILKYMCDNSQDLNLKIEDKVRSEMRRQYSHRKGFLGGTPDSGNSYNEKPRYLEVPNGGQKTGASSSNDLEYSFNNTHDYTRNSEKTENTLQFDIQDDVSYSSRKQRSYLDMNKFSTREKHDRLSKSSTFMQNYDSGGQTGSIMEIETPEERKTIVPGEIEEEDEEIYMESYYEDEASYESGNSIASEFLDEEESIVVVEEVKIEKSDLLLTGQDMTEAEKKIVTYSDFSHNLEKKNKKRITQTCISPRNYLDQYEKNYSSRDRRETAESYNNLMDACVNDLSKNSPVMIRMAGTLQNKNVDFNQPIPNKNKQKYSNKKTTQVEFLNELYDDKIPSSEVTKKMSRIFNTEKNTPEKVDKKKENKENEKPFEENQKKIEELENGNNNNDSVPTLNLTVAERSRKSSTSYFSPSPSQKEKLGKLARASNYPQPSSKHSKDWKIRYQEMDFHKQKKIVKISGSNSRNLSASNHIFELSDDSYHPSKNVSNFDINIGCRKFSKTEDERKFEKKNPKKSGVKRLQISGDKWDKKNKMLRDLKGNEFMTYDQVCETKNFKIHQKMGKRKKISKNKNYLEVENLKNSSVLAEKETGKTSVKSEISHSYYNFQRGRESSACECKMVYDSNDDQYSKNSAMYMDFRSNGKSSKNSRKLVKKKPKITPEKEKTQSTNTADFVANSSRNLTNISKNYSNRRIIPSKASQKANKENDTLSFQVSFKNIKSSSSVHPKMKKNIKACSEVNLPTSKQVEMINVNLKDSISTNKSKEIFTNPEAMQFRINYDRSRYYYKSHIPNNSYYDFNEGSFNKETKNREKSSNLFESISPHEILMKIQDSSEYDTRRESSLDFTAGVESLDTDMNDKNVSILDKYRRKVELKYIKTREDVDIVKYGSKAEELIKRGYSATPPMKMRNISIEKRSIDGDSKLIEKKRILVTSQEFQRDKENISQAGNVDMKLIPNSKRVIYFDSRKKNQSIEISNMSYGNVESNRVRGGGQIRTNLLNMFKESSLESAGSKTDYSAKFVRNVSNIKKSFEVKQSSRRNSKRPFLRDYRASSIDSKEYYKSKQTRLTGCQTTRVYSRNNHQVVQKLTPLKLHPKILKGSLNQIPRSANRFNREKSIERRVTPMRAAVRYPATQRGNITARSIDSNRSYRMDRSFKPSTPVHFVHMARKVTPVRKVFPPTIVTTSNEKVNLIGNTSYRQNHTPISTRATLINSNVTPIRKTTKFINSSKDVNNPQNQKKFVQKLNFTPNYNSKQNRKERVTPQNIVRRKRASNQNNPLLQTMRDKTPPKRYNPAPSSIETIKRSPINPKDPSHPFNASQTMNNSSQNSSHHNPLLAYMGTQNFKTETSHPIGNIFRTPMSSINDTQVSHITVKPIKENKEKSEVVKKRILKRINRLLDKYDSGKEGYIPMNFVQSIVKDIYSWLGVEDNISIRKDTQDYVEGICDIETKKGRGKGVWEKNGFKRNNVEEYLLKRLNYCGDRRGDN